MTKAPLYQIQLNPGRSIKIDPILRRLPSHPARKWIDEINLPEVFQAIKSKGLALHTQVTCYIFHVFKDLSFVKDLGTSGAA